MGEVNNLCQEQGGKHASTPSIAAPAFVGLKIALEIASQLPEFATPLNQLSVRRVAPTDIHVTLVPPSNEANIPDAIEKLRRVVAKYGFSGSFSSISATVRMLEGPACYVWTAGPAR